MEQILNKKMILKTVLSKDYLSILFYLITNNGRKEERGRPILEYAIDLLLKLDEKKNRDFRQTLSLLLTRPESSYSISTWRPFLFFMMDLIKQNDPNFTESFWNQKSIKLLQYLTRKEVLIGFGRFLHPFNSREIDVGLRAFIKALKRTQMTPYEIVEILREFTDFFTRWYMGAKPSMIPRIYHVEKSLQSLISQDISIDSYKSIDEILKKVDKNLPNFSDQTTSSLFSQFHPLMNYFTRNTFELLHIYKNHFNNTQKNISESYQQKLIASFASFLYQDNPKGIHGTGVFVIG